MPDTYISEDRRHADFLRAVDMLGGQRATARILNVAERTVRALVSRDRRLHIGYMRDITAALRDHAGACTALARQTDPLFNANRTLEEQEKADG